MALSTALNPSLERRRLLGATRLLTLGMLPLTPAWASDEGEPLQWLAGDLPPFVWREQGQAKGYGVELLSALNRKLGRRDALTFYPWARAVEMAGAKQHYGIFPLVRSAEREARFKWLIPLGRVHDAFLTLADASGRSPTLEEIRNTQVGILRGSPTLVQLKSKGFTRIYEATDYQELLRLLSRHLIDYVFASEPMLRSSIEGSPFPASDFRFVRTQTELTAYMAASPTVSDAEAEQWLQAYEALVKEGEVARLRARYKLPP